MTSKMITVALGALLLFSSISVATEAPEAVLVQRLLEIPQLKDEMVASAGRSVPPGTTSEITMALFRSDERIWAALATELPPLLVGRFPRERLEALAKSYGENPEAEWRQSGAELLALIWNLAAGDSQLRKAIFRSGCSAGFLAPNIAAARKKVGKEDTPFKATPQFIEAIQSALPPIGETCDCIVRHGEETLGEKFFSDQMPREERGALMTQLMTNGRCPDPFASFR
jgi:hypothetical protein